MFQHDEATLAPLFPHGSWIITDLSQCFKGYVLLGKRRHDVAPSWRLPTRMVFSNPQWQKTTYNAIGCHSSTTPVLIVGAHTVLIFLHHGSLSFLVGFKRSNVQIRPNITRKAYRLYFSFYSESPSCSIFGWTSNPWCPIISSFRRQIGIPNSIPDLNQNYIFNGINQDCKSFDDNFILTVLHFWYLWIGDQLAEQGAMHWMPNL